MRAQEKAKCDVSRRWSIVFFPADDAPHWRRGMVRPASAFVLLLALPLIDPIALQISLLVLAPVMVVLTLAARYLQLRDQRLAAQKDGAGEERGSARVVEVMEDVATLRRADEGQERVSGEAEEEKVV